jgi:hypothetical protein
MSVSDKVTLSGPGAYIARLERDLASMRASRDALAVALEGAEVAMHGAWQMLLAINDCDPSRDRLRAAERAAERLGAIRAALAAAQSKGEAS